MYRIFNIIMYVIVHFIIFMIGEGNVMYGMNLISGVFNISLPCVILHIIYDIVSC